ncbi:MAG TPA: hypothetical protein VGG48_16125 [Rhizomicrobium sp.]|jgi:predicted transcriptional regulator
MSDVIGMAAIIFAALLIYRFRARITGALDRFDDRMTARRREEMADRLDQLAHYKHTLRLAEEQVETVEAITVPDERTAQPVTRYLFEGEQFATREEADEARTGKIRAIARGFYQDLPRALTERRKGKLN